MGKAGQGTSPFPSSGRRSFTQPPTVGRRPSSPGFLAVVGVAWIACGLVELFALTASWRIAAAVVFFGIGLLFLRGASAAVLRRAQTRGTPDDN